MMKNNNKNLTKKDEKILMVFLVSIIIFLEVVLIIYVVANTQLFQFILAMVLISISNILFIFLKDFKGSGDEIVFQIILDSIVLWFFSFLGCIVIAVSYFILFS